MKKEILAMSNKKKKKEPLSREQICRSSRFRKDTDTPNPFDEEVPVKKAYAIYLFIILFYFIIYDLFDLFYFFLFF